MARNSKIRWRKRDQNDVKRLERNVKRKQARLRSKYGVKVAFKFKAERTLKRGNRKEFNEYKKQLKKFTEYGEHRYKRVSDNYSVPLSEYQQFAKNLKTVNKRNAKIRDKLDNIVRYDSQGNAYTKKDSFMYSILGDYLTEPFKPKVASKDYWNKSDFEKYRDYISRLANPVTNGSIQKQMQNNYMQALVRTLGTNLDDKVDGIDADGLPNYSIDYKDYLDDPKLAKVIKNLSDLSFEQFITMYVQQRGIEFSFIYDREQRDNNLELIETAIGRVMNES